MCIYLQYSTIRAHEYLPSLSFHVRECVLRFFAQSFEVIHASLSASSPLPSPLKEHSIMNGKWKGGGENPEEKQKQLPWPGKGAFVVAVAVAVAAAVAAAVAHRADAGTPPSPSLLFLQRNCLFILSELFIQGGEGGRRRTHPYRPTLR